MILLRSLCLAMLLLAEPALAQEPQTAKDDAPPVQAEHPRGDEQAVVAVGDEVDADRGDDDPQRADRLSAGERHGGERERADDGDQEPHQMPCDSHDVLSMAGCVEPPAQFVPTTEQDPSARRARLRSAPDVERTKGRVVGMPVA